MKKHAGMTLIESVIAIVLLAIAMASFINFFVPSVEKSATAQYQMRAILFGQGLMGQIMARGFDEHSDYDGGLTRCGEGTSCSTVLGDDGETNAAYFNDVDDYIGCWYTPTTEAECPVGVTKRALGSGFSVDMADQYANFRVDVNVFYDQNMDGVDDCDTTCVPGTLKRIEMRVHAGQYGSYPLVAYRGNY